MFLLLTAFLFMILCPHSYLPKPLFPPSRMDCIDSHLVLNLVGKQRCDQSCRCRGVCWRVVSGAGGPIEMPAECLEERQPHWSIRNLLIHYSQWAQSNRSEPRATTHCHQCRHWLSGLISVCLACQINAFLTACRPCRRPQMNISYPLWSNHNSKRNTQLTLLLLW